MILTQWLFCWSLFLSTLVTLSASMPLYMWAGLEVNTIAFIPMMLDSDKPESVRASMKYFFIQAYASLIFLTSPLLETIPNLFIFVAMLMKLGMSPFHNWYPSVVMSLNWPSILLISTWQKIAPLWILSENNFFSPLLLSLAALNAMVGGMGGLMQTEIRPLLAFSSIGHMGWLLVSLPFSLPIMYIYFLSYTLHLIILIYSLNKLATTSPKDLSFSLMVSSQNKYTLAFTLLSFGGLPPLLGFIPKLLTLWTISPFSILPIFLMLGSYMNIFYYMSIMWSSFMTSPQPMISNLSPKYLYYILILLFSSLFLILTYGLNMHL